MYREYKIKPHHHHQQQHQQQHQHCNRVLHEYQKLIVGHFRLCVTYIHIQLSTGHVACEYNTQFVDTSMHTYVYAKV